MVESKRAKKVRSLRATVPPQRRHGKQTGTAELVLTLRIPGGEVVKVELLDKSEQRRELSEEELADLAGEDEDDVLPEEAYALGIADSSEEDESELDEQGAVDEEALERFILREMIARQLLWRGVRRFILRRLRRRESIRNQPRAAVKPPHRAGYKPHNNGHQGTGDEG